MKTASKKHELSTANRFSTLSQDQEECILCQEIFTNNEDHLVQCERCNKWCCQKCTKLSDTEYTFLTKDGNNIHYFCDKCEAPAMTAVHTDQEIENRCKKYCEVIEARLDQVEQEVASKASKQVVSNIDVRLTKVEDEIKDTRSDISKVGSTITLVRNEREEIEKREKNLIIRGIPESDFLSDLELVKETLKGIGLPELEVEKVDRLGPKKDTSNSSETRPRPIRVKLDGVDKKRLCLRNATKIRQYSSDLLNTKKIFIVPDQTKLQREEDLNLRRGLQKKREENPDAVSKIRRGKITKE